MRWLPILVLATSAVVLAACDGQSVSVRLVNDSDATVDFLQCKSGLFGDDCEDIGGRSGHDLAPGESYMALIGVGTTTWYRVDDAASGSTIGCLRMKVYSYGEGFEAFASQAVECP